MYLFRQPTEWFSTVIMAGGNKRYNRILVDIAESILICTNGYCAEESVSEKTGKLRKFPLEINYTVILLICLVVY